MDVFTASLRSACSLRRGHFVNNLKGSYTLPLRYVFVGLATRPWLTLTNRGSFAGSPCNLPCFGYILIKILSNSDFI
ncbi:hypothetical protein HTQ63_07760 [Yersinia pestis subsp. pestis]|uniref:Gluconate 5-dehydrogenase n=1 Tax=Yersinia pseudotuberculosis serotype O:3 (strain YPIII) TaxID=502800 RepID=A0A0H3AWD7_YERPY|nr:hypothetical protein EGX87_02510 [Yersinia pseudotuberculosis]AYX23287.1 hypothetical protein EGX74_05400 [Yersinia pestis]MBF4412567.1 hypothetical protein [Yersinia pestis subsp. pestis]QFR83472.1 hypothetical protein DJY80_00150 [Yersinia pestis subsp. pestis bv. Medievalis]QQD40661.1 hypothetical protein AH66_000120 [Yersinia pestis EV NIIEG]